MLAELAFVIENTVFHGLENRSHIEQNIADQLQVVDISLIGFQLF